MVLTAGSGHYSATTDLFQGILLRDETQADAKWFWINWDMDHSFMDMYGGNDDTWELDIFDVLETRRLQMRATLWRRLMAESPTFRESFISLFTEVLNHRLTQEFLQSRVDFYERVAIEHDIEDRTFIDKMREFFRRRHAVVREQLQGHLAAGVSYRCTVTGPGNISFEVDGYEVGRDYAGWYFTGTPILVRVEDSGPRVFSHWLVNGRETVSSGPVLEVPVTSTTVIEAVFTRP